LTVDIILAIEVDERPEVSDDFLEGSIDRPQRVVPNVDTFTFEENAIQPLNGPSSRVVRTRRSSTGAQEVGPVDKT
jgi:hypothetical protein